MCGKSTINPKSKLFKQMGRNMYNAARIKDSHVSSRHSVGAGLLRTYLVLGQSQLPFKIPFYQRNKLARDKGKEGKGNERKEQNERQV
jgi:hypothetical protein